MVESAGQSERRTEDLAERILELEADYEQDPSRRAVELAEAYLADGRAKEAIRVLEKLESTGIDAQILLSQAYFDSFDNDKAHATIAAARSHGNLGDSLRAQLLLGELLVEAGDADGAKAPLQRALELSPHNRRAAQLLSNLGENVLIPDATRADDLDESELEQLRSDHEFHESPRRALRHVGIGFLAFTVLVTVYVWSVRRAHEAKVLVVEALPLLENGDVLSLRLAEKKFLDALEVDGGNEYAVASLAELYALLWVDHGIAEAKPRAVDYVAMAVDKDIEKGERYSAEALLALGEGRLEDVERIGDAVAKRGGVSEKLYFAVGLAQRALGKPKSGRDYLRRAQDLSSSAVHYATALGDAYDDDGDARNAAFYWSVAAKTNSSYTIGAARDLLARIRKGEPENELKATFERLEALPEDAVGPRDLAAVALARAALRLRKGETAEATNAANAAIALGGSTPRALALKARAQVADGKQKEGLLTYEEAYRTAASALGYLYGYASLQAEAGEYEGALAALQAHAVALEDDPEFHSVRGGVLLRKGDLSAAAEAYGTALSRSKDYPEALLGLGRVAIEERKFDAATEHLERAVTARPDFPEVYEAVGLMWIAQRAFGDAHKQLEAAERMFRSRGVSARRMNQFYGDVIRGYAASRRAPSYIKIWVEKERAFRTGG